jgi:Tol biopolymer transport system component
LKKYQVALLALLVMAAAITVGCGNSNSVPTFTKMPMWSNRTVTPATQLFTMALDGSSVTPVQAGSNGVWGLSVSADFKTAAYISAGEVWSISPAAGTPTQLTQNVTNNSSSNTARISPNGQKIVYPVFTNSTGVGSIWIMNADGTGSTNLTATMPTGMSSCYIASFSADSSKIAFACQGNSGGAQTFGLYTMHTDGTQLTTVLTQTSTVDTPAFTPDGKQVLFITYGTPGAELKHASACADLGRHHQRLQPLVPCSNNQGVASVNLDGSNATIIVASNGNDIWESEILNSTLYYMTFSSSASHNQIFKANFDGTGSTSISDGTADDELGLCTQC